MNIPIINGTLKTCKHNKEQHQTPLKVKHRKLITYIKNIILWLDPK